MKKQKKISITICLLLYVLILSAQTSEKQKPQQKESGPEEFPEFIFAKIPGAPQLSRPILITGTQQPVISQGHGLAAPAFYDWDGDGVKDLLIGEFGSGLEQGKFVGNFIRVYKNIGTDENPAFTGKWDYARPPFKYPGNGTPYSVDQYCCIGFTPQFIDLNKDGYMDMVTGSYYGEVYCFKGSKDGFAQQMALTQASPPEGDPRNGQTTKKAHQRYWLYASASFGDFTGDGLPDLVTGGTMALHISKNIGTMAEPEFGEKELLLDINGQPLKVYQYTKEELKFYEDRRSLGYEAPIAGDDHLSPYVVDWDRDGTPDLLVTNNYMHKGLAVVDFFKGVNTKDGVRFQPAVPLFTVANKGKAFPGMGPRAFVCDWNNDGINDLLIGTSVVSIDGQFSKTFSWEWQDDNGILPAGKDAGLVYEGLPPEMQEKFKEQEKKKIPENVSIDDYLKIRHQGYIYVLLGKN